LSELRSTIRPYQWRIVTSASRRRKPGNGHPILVSLDIETGTAGVPTSAQAFAEGRKVADHHFSAPRPKREHHEGASDAVFLD
jgi:hypothetical protein